MTGTYRFDIFLSQAETFRLTWAKLGPSLQLITVHVGSEYNQVKDITPYNYYNLRLATDWALCTLPDADLLYTCICTRGMAVTLL